MTASNPLAWTLTAFTRLAHRLLRAASTSTRLCASSPCRRAGLAYGLWPGVILLGLLGRPAQAVDITTLPVTFHQPGTYTMTVDLDYPASGAHLSFESPSTHPTCAKQRRISE